MFTLFPYCRQTGQSLMEQLLTQIRLYKHECAIEMCGCRHALHYLLISFRVPEEHYCRCVMIYVIVT